MRQYTIIYNIMVADPISFLQSTVSSRLKTFPFPKLSLPTGDEQQLWFNIQCPEHSTLGREQNWKIEDLLLNINIMNPRFKIEMTFMICSPRFCMEQIRFFSLHPYESNLWTLGNRQPFSSFVESAFTTRYLWCSFLRIWRCRENELMGSRWI